MKHKYYLIFGIIVVVGIILIGVYIQQSTTTPSIDMGVDLSISKAPVLNQEAELILSFTSPRAATNGRAQIRLPEGFELVSGDLIYEGPLIENEKIQLKAVIKAVKTGEWTIIGAVAGTNNDYLYISVSENSAYISEKPFTNFNRNRTPAESE